MFSATQVVLGVPSFVDGQKVYSRHPEAHVGLTNMERQLISGEKLPLSILGMSISDPSE